MDGFKEFLESSTIHGLVYIATNRRVARLLWICIVIAGFTIAGDLIYQSFSSWEESPVLTTIETRSISDLEFPGVVVCPAQNSFTTLNPDLIRSDKNSWDQNTTRRLEEIFIEATFDLNVENKYKTMSSFFEKDMFFNWYKGESMLEFPSIKKKSRWGLYQGYVTRFSPQTSAVSGSFSTPYFGEIFHEEDFELGLFFYINIYVPDKERENGSISLVIDINYDIEGNTEAVYVSSSETCSHFGEKLNATEKKYKKEYSLKGDVFYIVSFVRRIRRDESTYQRHTGMRVSWYYNVTVQPDQKYLSDNQEFITLANAIHENRTGIRKELMRERHEALNYGNDEDAFCCESEGCSSKTDLKLPSLDNVSAKPVYKNNITGETLATAAKLYHYFREGFIQISKVIALYSVHNITQKKSK